MPRTKFIRGCDGRVVRAITDGREYTIPSSVSPETELKYLKEAEAAIEAEKAALLAAKSDPNAKWECVTLRCGCG